MVNLTRRQINVNVWTDCKVFDPLYYFCRQYSSSLLMIMTVEKCFALYFPLKSKIISTVSTAKKICATVAFALFGWNLQHIFLSDGKTSSNGEKYCIWLHIPLYYIKALNLTDLSLYSYIPICVMSTANCLIVLKFMMAKWKNRHGGTESVSQALSKSAVRGSVMLLTVSFLFIVLTGPYAFAYSRIMGNPSIIVYCVTIILNYLNHSINGVLYCVSGSRFRQELRSLFGSCGRKRSATSHTMNTVTSQVSSTHLPSHVSISINKV